MHDAGSGLLSSSEWGCSPSEGTGLHSEGSPGCPGCPSGTCGQGNLCSVLDELQPYLNHSDLDTMTSALVTSRLDYFSTLYMGLPLKTVWKLQLVQNVAVHVVAGSYPAI